jgi:hypothetical protein
VLRAGADRSVGLTGAKVAILGCPPTQPLRSVAVIERDNAPPHSLVDGVWAKASSDVKASYLFVDLTKTNFEDVIGYATLGGFRYIWVYEGVWKPLSGTPWPRDATGPREIEYAWSRALAYGAAMSLETCYDELRGNGRTAEIFSIIRRWEELRLTNYFPQSIRDRLKVPDQESRCTGQRAETGIRGQWRQRQLDVPHSL